MVSHGVSSISQLSCDMRLIGHHQNESWFNFDVWCLSSVLVAEHLIAQHSAIKMLHSRVKIILEYVKAVEAGERMRGSFNDGVRAKNVKINLKSRCF